MVGGENSMTSPLAEASQEELLVVGAENSRKKQRTEDPHSLEDTQVHEFRPAGMQRYLVAVEYIGSRYLGCQKQKCQDGKTVQGALEEAFSKFVGKSVESACSSRTDAGVHALRNVCHVDVERVSKRRPGEILPPHEPEVVKRAVNHFLQRSAEDMQVLDVQCVPPNFHARFAAKERTYHYRIIVSAEALSIFEKDRAWHVHEELDIGAMKQACQVLVGHHDFSSFRTAGCQAKSPIRTLDELHICETLPWPCFPSQIERCRENLQDNKNSRSSPAEGVGEENYLQAQFEDSELGSNAADNSKLSDQAVMGMDAHGRKTEFARPNIKKAAKTQGYVVTARARSFLYHQVRLMVGLLKAVGTGELKLPDVQRILEARTVTQMPPMAPACGLYLADVKYEFNSINTADNHE